MNQSERYTEEVERRLNANFSSRIRVINAGFAGAGTKDQYLYLYQHGRHLNPDIIVSTIKPLDDLSKSWHDRHMAAVLQKHGLNGSGPRTLRKHPSAWKEYKQRVLSFMANRTWNNSDILTYGNMIADIAQRDDIRLFYYKITQDFERDHHLKTPLIVDGERYPSTLMAWKDVCKRSLIDRPSHLEITFQESPYTFPDDPHYNSRGHDILARRLSERLSACLRRVR